MIIDGHKIVIEKKDIKHLYIKIDGINRLINISAPNKLKDEKIKEIVDKRKAWIQLRLEELKEKLLIPKVKGEDGEEIYFFGHLYRLKISYISRFPLKIAIKGDEIHLAIKKDTSKAKIKDLIYDWYRDQLLKEIEILIKKWEPIMDIGVDEFRTKSMKTRWGSCNINKKRIWINLDLVKLPIRYLEYVVVHEMVHLFERGHGSAFKKKLSHYLPNWKTLEKEMEVYIIES